MHDKGRLTGVYAIEMGQLIRGAVLAVSHGATTVEVNQDRAPKVGDAMRSWGKGIRALVSSVSAAIKSR